MHIRSKSHLGISCVIPLIKQKTHSTTILVNLIVNALLTAPLFSQCPLTGCSVVLLAVCLVWDRIVSSRLEKNQLPTKLMHGKTSINFEDKDLSIYRNCIYLWIYMKKVKVYKSAFFVSYLYGGSLNVASKIIKFHMNYLTNVSNTCTFLMFNWIEYIWYPLALKFLISGSSEDLHLFRILVYIVTEGIKT